MHLALALVLLTACVYAGAYLAVRWRLAQHRNPFDVMEIQWLLAIWLKGKRTGFLLEEPQGYYPCPGG